MKYLVLIVLLFSCQLLQKKNKNDKKVSKQFKSLKREGELGKRVSVRILKKYPRYEQAQVQNYISNLGRSAVVRMGRQELYYYFAVLESNEKRSFSAPGGFIFVTTAMIKSLKSESQLVGVLAQEIALVNKKYLLKVASKEKDLKKAADKIFSHLLENKYSVKQKRAVDYEAILGMVSLNYSVKDYAEIAGDPTYAKKFSAQVLVNNPHNYADRFRQLKNRM